MIALMCIVLLPVGTAWAQSGAADPNAIDLRTIIQMIDTTTDNFNPSDNLTIGDINGDSFDDLIFTNQIHFGGSQILLMQSNPIISQLPEGHGDFVRKFVQDLVTSPTGDHLYFYNNKTHYPYYDSLPISQFGFKSYLSDMGFGKIIDYDADGNIDLMAVVSDFFGENSTSYIILYRSSDVISPDTVVYTRFPNYKYVLVCPSDSIAFPSHTKIGTYGGLAVDQFAKGKKPMLCLAVEDTELHHGRVRVGLLQNSVSLSQDSFVWISNTDSEGVAVRSLYSMDITGDGTADLLVSDGDSIYIYKGNDNFGKYLLTKKNAYYVIPSPAHLDGYYALAKGFGSYMQNCGDLTGSGVPVLMTTAQQSDQFGGAVTYAFLYCGGKALDSLYDAVYSEDRYAGFTIQPVNAVDATHRPAAVFQSAQSWGEDFLIYKNADKIPHRTNPNLGIVKTHVPNFAVDVWPSVAQNFVKVNIENIGFGQDATIEIRNILGATLEKRPLGVITDSHLEELDVSQFPDGVYLVKVTIGSHEQTIKFMVNR